MAWLVLYVSLTLPPASAQDSLVFGARTGVVLNMVKAESVAEFETALTDLERALKTSDNPVREQQAAGWRFFKAEEPGPGGSVVFVFVVSPVLPGADYSLRTIFEEAFPEEEAAKAYRRFADSLAAGQTVLNLELIADMTPPARKPAQPRRR